MLAAAVDTSLLFAPSPGVVFLHLREDVSRRSTGTANGVAAAIASDPRDGHRTSEPVISLSAAAAAVVVVLVRVRVLLLFGACQLPVCGVSLTRRRGRSRPLLDVVTLAVSQCLLLFRMDVISVYPIQDVGGGFVNLRDDALCV